ncbi:MAG: translocation/assembly module TamB domain-containing protein [Deltaproteobacteria bacterium]|nr:translocation/assembly module TamB domain-containing protein [Deltaproteobacteria bacterium]
MKAHRKKGDRRDRRKAQARWILVAILVVTVAAPLILIQSKYFAARLTKFAVEHLLADFGIDGAFSSLSVKILPPGVVLHDPSITLKGKNVVGLPSGTKLDAKGVEVTFELFQLFSGAVNISGVTIHGAKLKLDLDRGFFKGRDRDLEKRRAAQALSWDKLFRFNFRGVGLADSSLDLKIALPEGQPIVLRTYAKELTVGKGSLDKDPAYDFAFDLGATALEVFGMKQDLTQLRASVGISSNQVQLRSFSLQDATRNLHVEGLLRGNILEPKSMKAGLRYIVRGPVTEWLKDPSLGRYVKLPPKLDAEGMLRIEGAATADFADFEKTLETRVTAEVEEARIAGWRAEKAELQVAWKPPVATLEQAEIRLGDGSVRVNRASYDTNLQAGSLSAKIELANANLHRLLGPLADDVFFMKMSISGDADTELSWSRKSKSAEPSILVKAKTDFQIKDFSIDNQKPRLKKPLKVLLAIPSLGLKSSIEAGTEGVRVERAEASLASSALVATGKIDGKDGFDLDIRGDVRLQDLGKLSAFEIAGQGPLHWTVKGKKPDVLLTFDAQLKEGRYLNLNLGDVVGRIVWDDSKDTLRFKDLKTKQGRLESVANGSVNLGATDVIDMNVKVPRGTIQDFAKMFTPFLDKSVPWYPYDLTGQMSGEIAVSGKTDTSELVILGDMEISNADYRLEAFRQGTFRAGYVRGGFVGENISLQKKNGWLRGNVAFGADDVLKFDVRTDGFSTYDIDRLGLLDIPYRAPITFEAQGNGKIGALKGSLHLNVGAGIVKNYVIPSSDLTLQSDGVRLKAKASVFGGRGNAAMDLGWRKGDASSFEGSSEKFDFLPALVALNPAIASEPGIGSEVSGSAKLQFRTGEMSRLSGVIDLKSFALRRPRSSVALERPFHLDIRDGNYRFEGTRFKGENTDLLVGGKVEDGRIAYDLGGSWSLAFLELLVPEIESFHGVAKVKGGLSGAADSPVFKADIEVAESDARFRSIEQPFESLKYRVHWDDSAVRVSDIAAKFAGGRASGSGRAELYYYKAPDLDFQFLLDNTKVKVYPVTYARASGRIAVKGTALPYRVKGSFVISEALIRENFNVSEGSRVLRSSKFFPQGGRGGSGDFELLDLDLDLVADKGITVRNDLFDSELRGNLKVIQSLRSPRLLGNVSVLHGKLFFKDNYFAIQSGNLRFTNPAVLDPEFDLTGQTEMKGYKIFLVATGKVSDYQLNFQSQPPLSQNDIVNLLTLGVTSSGFQNLSRGDREAYTRDEMYGLLFTQTSINRGLQEKFGVKLRLDQSQNLAPESIFRAQSGDVSATVSPKVVLQKQITKNLNASAGTTVGVGDSRQQSLNLEYEMGRRWSLLGVYEDQRGAQPQNSRTSLGADLKFKLRFK